MSQKELQRVEVLGRVASKQLRLGDAAVLLQLGYRQAKRLWRKYQQKGAAGLKHGNAGGSSNRAKSAKFREQVLSRVREKYSGAEAERFGPTLAAEHLAAEDGLEMDAETLRRWMLEERLWSRQRKRKPYRQRRERKAHFGELVQLDGSFHDWLEGRGPSGCLMNMVDDATSDSLCRLDKEETIWAAAGVLRAWIRRYGVPLALYTDWKNVYKRQPTAKEVLQGVVAETAFGRMCSRLGILIIGAGSAQAKGRVERNHGTHQDRLVKKLRRQGINDYAAANAYLEKVYLPEHNRRFARAPLQPPDYHRRAPNAAALRRALCLETQRRVGNDWVVRYKRQYLQLQRQSRSYVPAGAQTTVCEYEDGALEVYYRDQRIAFVEIVEKQRPAKVKRFLPVPWHPLHRPEPQPPNGGTGLAVSVAASVPGEPPSAPLREAPQGQPPPCGD
jgi:transposase